jgi:hypothetical protein
MRFAAWVSSSDRALTLAASQIRLIRAVTPTNADAELAELAQAFRRETPRLPRWRYDAPPVPPELPRALDELATFLENEPPLGPLYAARARELCLEAELVAAAGTPRLTALARERFLASVPPASEDMRNADELALAWTREPVTEDAQAPVPVPHARAKRTTGMVDGSAKTPACAGDGGREMLIRSCDAKDPRSLLSRLASEVGRRHLPMRVSVQSGMASLAATGDGVILVAQKKWLSRRDIERTVLHEIEGHALPRARAARAPLALFAFGTARGIDDQEGRAIAIEERAGFLDRGRQFELGCRHLAARATLDGADFTEIVGLLRSRGATTEATLRIAARVQRGSHGVGGLAREVVYLSARCKVGRLVGGPDGREIEQVMRGGRVAADVALHLAAVLSNEERGQRSGLGGHFCPSDSSNGDASDTARRPRSDGFTGSKIL